MASCSNCKRNLSCGCQKRVASDKTSVCTNCLSAYESKLKTIAPKVKPSPPHITARPQIWGKDRYKK
jgi:hypothetical protein